LTAWVAALGLVWSSLDKIPDCPQLLNLRTRGSVALISAAHYGPALTSGTLLPAQMTPRPRLSAIFVLERTPVAPCCVVSGSIEQAADASPPIA